MAASQCSREDGFGQGDPSRTRHPDRGVTVTRTQVDQPVDPRQRVDVCEQDDAYGAEQPMQRAQALVGLSKETSNQRVAVFAASERTDDGGVWIDDARRKFRP